MGFAEFDMDGRVFTGGEMDRMMMISASQKYPCSRPATFDEYAAAWCYTSHSWCRSDVFWACRNATTVAAMWSSWALGLRDVSYFIPTP